MFKHHLKRVLVYTFSISWAIATLYPLFFTLMSSFKDTDSIYYRPFALPGNWQFENYISTFGEHNMALGIGNSFLFAAGSVVLLILVASMAGFILSQFKYKINVFLFLFFTLGIMIPIHTTLIPLVRLINRAGMGNSYLSLILLYTSFNLPLAVLLITGYMRKVPRELIESAVMDGAGARTLLIKIAMPLTIPTLSTVGILCFQAIYNDLIFALLFINKKSMYTISLSLMRFKSNLHVELGPIFAAIIVAILPMIIIYILFQEKIESGLSAGALKG